MISFLPKPGSGTSPVYSNYSTVWPTLHGNFILKRNWPAEEESMSLNTNALFSLHLSVCGDIKYLRLSILTKQPLNTTGK